MKRLTLLFGFAAALTIGGGSLYLMSTPPTRSTERARDAAPASAPTASPPAVTSAASLARVQGEMPPPQPVTLDRRRIFDAPDILRVVEEVRHAGNPDEKSWALHLVSSCVRIFSKPLAVPADLNADLPKAASSPDSADVSELKKNADATLKKRCSGVNQLSLEDRRALISELREGYPGSSALGQLTVLTETGDSPWTPAQVQLIADSLYGGDPIVARQAFYALLAAFDQNSPGGKDRMLAFSAALGEEFTGSPLSDFERLDGCRSMGWCGSTIGPEKTPPPSSEVERLMAAYVAASRSHAGARAILAIR